jgi:hypothetical protein
MKTIKIAIFLIAALCGSAVAGTADAQHFRHHNGGGVRFGVFIGAPVVPYYYPRYYYAPAYYPYYAPAVVLPSAPVYVEQSAAAPAPTSSAYWYYCRESRTYYPYVQQCASPWQQVAPQ